MKKFLKGIIATLVISIMFLSSCGENISNALDESMVVYTSFAAMSAIAKPLIVNDATLIQLSSSNVEPHDFEPTSRDIVNISKTDMFIYNGLGFEHYIKKIEASVEGNVLFVNSAKNIGYTIDNEVGIDPHIWLNFENVITQASNITKSLIQIDEENEHVYSDNLTAFVNNVMSLREDYDDVLQDVDIEAVVVLHPAYGYIFEHYSIKQLAIQQDHDIEPTASELREVIDYINDNDINYIFAEDSESSKALYTVLSETNAKVLQLNSLENINLDDITVNTYVDIMSENLKNIELAVN